MDARPNAGRRGRIALAPPWFSTYVHFRNNGMSADSAGAIKRIDELGKEGGVKSYHDQRKPLMEKYGLRWQMKPDNGIAEQLGWTE